MRSLVRVLSFVRNVNNKIFNSAIRRLERDKRKKEIHRWSVQNPDEAIYFLKERVKAIVGKNPANPVLIVSGNPNVGRDFASSLNEESIHSVETDADKFESAISGNQVFSCIVSVYFHEAPNFKIASRLLGDARLINIPFEYIGNSFFDYNHWQKHERYTSNYFISPILHSDFDVLKIHADSLSKFELKCDVRDYLDIAQAMIHVKHANIPGDIAEFGSFKGHSGYLITQLARALKLNKNIYLFDMFESFPEEPIGIDAFWSKTHHVNFEEVRDKFKEFPNVKLVKGDFTKTLDGEKIKQMSLIHVDCDSFRATLYLMEELFDRVLAPGGVMIFEDYGHPGLLGTRVAVDEFFAKRTDCFQYFSQASGYYIVYKR